MTASWSITQADAVSWLRGLAPSSVNLVTTDPAYESLEKHRAVGTTTRLKHSKSSSNDWFPIFPNVRFEELFVEIYRVLARDAHFYMHCDQETAFFAKPIAERVGFKFWKALIWDKGPRIGMGYHYRAQHELILFFEKGKRRLNDLGIADILRFPRVDKRAGVEPYATEKPVGLSEVLIRQSSSEGDLVVDPFMGSASSGEAALKLGRSFLGCDVSDAAMARARVRLLATGVVEGMPERVRAPASSNGQGGLFDSIGGAR